MALTLYFHPLSSFCQKALIALYENSTPFTPQKVDLMDDKENAVFKRMWPVGKFPVLRDEKSGQTIPESTTIIEYLAQHYPGSIQLVPRNAGEAFTVRAQDRFYDLNVHLLTQKVITDRLRPAGQNDTFGVEHARYPPVDLLGRQREHTVLVVAVEKQSPYLGTVCFRRYPYMTETSHGTLILLRRFQSLQLLAVL